MPLSRVRSRFVTVACSSDWLRFLLAWAIVNSKLEFRPRKVPGMTLDHGRRFSNSAAAEARLKRARSTLCRHLSVARYVWNASAALRISHAFVPSIGLLRYLNFADSLVLYIWLSYQSWMVECLCILKNCLKCAVRVVAGWSLQNRNSERDSGLCGRLMEK